MMELIAVIAILSMMMALTAGTYIQISRRFKSQSAAAGIDVALRQARNSAIGTNAPAFVEINNEDRRVVPWAYKTVGQWHFEEHSSASGRTSGAYHEARLQGAEIVPEGKIGKCVKLNSTSSVLLGASPDFDFEDGGFLEAYVRATSGAFTGEQYIFFKDRAYSFKVGPGGILVGNAGKTLKSAYRLIPGRWTKVAFAWDSTSTRIMADDAVVARGPGSHPPVSDYPLLIGYKDAGSFIGLVDEVRVMTAMAGQELPLAKDCTLEHNAAPWQAVYFAPDGSLDMHYHAGPLTIKLIQDGKERRIDISLLGQITRGEVEEAPEKNADKDDSPPPKKTVKKDDAAPHTADAKPARGGS